MSKLKATGIICSVILSLVTAVSMTGCGSEESSASSSISAAETEQTAESSDAQSVKTDYMVLVNKENLLPDNWNDTIETAEMTNSVGDTVVVEKKAYDAYLELKAELEKEGIKVDLDSALRTVEEQQEIMDDFTAEKGEEYARQYVAKPGTSEHHTGLALDFYLNVDGKDLVENDDLFKQTEIWDKIHKKIAEHGFILRYLKGKEDITGYNYEPWHFRYIDDPDTAKEIMDKGITLEEYLNKLPTTDVAPPKS